VSPAKRNGRRFFISHAWFRKRKKKKIKQNQRLLGFDKMSFEGKSQTRVVGVLGSCIFVVACFNWSKRQVVGQPKKKKEVGACFFVSRFRQKLQTLFKTFLPVGFTKARANKRQNFYWASYNNGHYSSAHIQQKVQESKEKSVSELTNWTWFKAFSSKLEDEFFF